MTGDWRRAVLSLLGAKPTPANMRFLASWQRWEGGHTNNDAKYNWLNTTYGGPGAVGSINSVGVKRFNSFANGTRAIATTLMNGRYDDIVAGLKAGNPYKYDVRAGLETWVSGSPTGNPSYADKVLGGAGVPKAALPASYVGGRGPTGNPGLAPSLPSIDPELVRAVFGGGELGRLALSAFGSAKPSVPAYGGMAPNPKQRAQPVAHGPGIHIPLSWKGTHVTDGLGWGTDTAEDIMGSPGTPVSLSEDVTVVYFHPTGAQGGGSMLVRTKSGREYWLGHIANGVKAGTRVRAGRPLAVISADHPRPHVHVDRRG